METNSASNEANVAAVRAYFAAAGKGDVNGLLATLAADATLEVPASLPYGGVYTGHEGFQKALAAFAAAWESNEVTDLLFVGEGDLVVALSQMNAKAKGTGQTVPMPIAEVFHLRNGKIVSVQPFYYDTAKLARVLASQIKS